MKTVKSLLLGSAAGFVALTGAQAADLPMAEPVEYVKVCSTYGEGFFYIPGTDTCLQISGRVRVDMTVEFSGDDDDDGFLGSPQDDDFHTRARGVLGVDARTETEWGTLRSYIEFEANSDTGDYSNPFGEIEMVAGFLQFAGITAGRASSFFDYADYSTFADFFSSEDVWTLAYTASFGSGFAATIAIEDKTYRAKPGADLVGLDIDIDLIPFGVDVNGVFDDTLDQTWPNIVAALRVDQAWGSAQISAAVQDNAGDREDYDYGDPTIGFDFPTISIFLPGDFDVEDEIGWAVQAGVTFNLPFATEGSYVWVQGAYSEGAVSYAGGEEDIFSFTGFDVVDQSIGNFADGLENNTLWQVGGGAAFQATENVVFNLAATYSQYEEAGSDSTQEFILAEANVFWTPVDNLDLGLGVIYGQISDDEDDDFEQDDLQVKMRIQRDF